MRRRVRRRGRNRMAEIMERNEKLYLRVTTLGNTVYLMADGMIESAGGW